MNHEPCPLCGYDRSPLTAGTAGCPHCALAPRDRSLAERRRGVATGVAVGLAALPRGVYYLATTAGVKRWLVPPFVLTVGAFALLFYGLWRLVAPLIETVGGGAELPLPEGWWKSAAEWLIQSALFQILAHLAGFALFGALAYLAAALAFSLVYEAFAGPFLDEIHGRIEERWFGRNPRDALQRPTSLAPRRCAEISALAGAGALLALVPWWLLDGWLAWLTLLVGAAAALAIAARLEPEYGRWLAWVVRLEGGTLWVSVKAMIVAGLVLLLFLPLQFLVPVVGQFLFAGAAGFTTALSLLDIPFSRRQWSLRQRLRFLTQELPAVVTFGAVSSLVFVVPLVGPILMVPAASAGGLWLICRLDKPGMVYGEAEAKSRAQ
jgi:uncharacterized protein involved in cysteine biosynthesis